MIIKADDSSTVLELKDGVVGIHEAGGTFSRLSRSGTLALHRALMAYFLAPKETPTGDGDTLDELSYDPLTEPWKLLKVTNLPELIDGTETPLDCLHRLRNDIRKVYSHPPEFLVVDKITNKMLLRDQELKYIVKHSTLGELLPETLPDAMKRLLDVKLYFVASAPNSGYQFQKDSPMNSIVNTIVPPQRLSVYMAPPRCEVDRLIVSPKCESHLTPNNGRRSGKTTMIKNSFLFANQEDRNAIMTALKDEDITEYTGDFGLYTNGAPWFSLTGRTQEVVAVMERMINEFKIHVDRL